MSVRRVPKRKGGGYEVRYRQGNRHRSRTFRSRADADEFDREVKRRRRLGSLADLDAGRELLSDFGADWWQLSASKRLAAKTRKDNAELWDRHVLPRLGDYELRQLKAGVIEDELVAAALTAGVGLPTVRKALYMLRSCLAYAVRRELVPFNPARDVELPRQRRRAVRPIAPLVIERIRAELEPRDAMLVELLGYQGLRPGEALALGDDEVRERTLLIDSGIALGEEKDTKTHRIRTVKLLGPVVPDLAEYQLATRKERLAARARRSRPGRLLLFPRADGEPWRATDYANWRRRVFKPAYRRALGLAADAPAPRPYDLRHTFVSLLVQEGRPLAYVAGQAGHSPEECARTYTHLFEEFEDAPGVAAEELIRRARSQLESERRAV